MSSGPDRRRGDDPRGHPAREWVALGVLTRPHGLRGEIRMHLYNPESRLLWDRDRVWLRNAGGDVREVALAQVREVRARSGRAIEMILRLEGAERREDAEALRGQEVCVPKAELPPLEEDEFYVADLVGLRVRLEDGTFVGEVVDVLTYPSVSCLRVRPRDAGPAGGADLEVPMVEPWVERVVPEAGEVVVAQLEDVPRVPAGDRGSRTRRRNG